MVPDFDDLDQEAKDHGNLIDEGVAEVEKEGAEAAGGQDHRPAGQAAESLPPTDRPTGAAAFSEAQMAEEDPERQKARNGPSKPTEGNRGSDDQAAELLAEQIAEAKDSVT
jgi:hypothetical protein